MVGSWVEFAAVVAFAVWLFVTGKALYHRFPAGIKAAPGSLLLSLILPVSLMAFVVIKMTLKYLTDQHNPNAYYSGTDPLLGKVFIIGALLGMLYALYFVARSIRTVEAGKRVPFYRCLDMFVALLFFPIGIWAVAPRLNKIAARQKEPEMDIFRP